MIDEFMPFKFKFEMPEPLGLKKKEEGKGKKEKKVETNAPYAETTLPVGERDSHNKILSNQEIIEKILSLQKLALESANYYI